MMWFLSSGLSSEVESTTNLLRWIFHSRFAPLNILTRAVRTLSKKPTQPRLNNVLINALHRDTQDGHSLWKKCQKTCKLPGDKNRNVSFSSTNFTMILPLLIVTASTVSLVSSVWIKVTHRLHSLVTVTWKQDPKPTDQISDSHSRVSSCSWASDTPGSSVCLLPATPQCTAGGRRGHKAEPSAAPRSQSSPDTPHTLSTAARRRATPTNHRAAG